MKISKEATQAARKCLLAGSTRAYEKIIQEAINKAVRKEILAQGKVRAAFRNTHRGIEIGGPHDYAYGM